MKPTLTLLTALLLAPLAVLHAAGQPAPKRPNIVFIITDQQKPEATICAGEFPTIGKRQTAKFQ